MQGAESAASLTRRLLAFSRQQPLKPERSTCNKLITGMSDLLRRTIPERSRSKRSWRAGLWRTHVDPSGLESAHPQSGGERPRCHARRRQADHRVRQCHLDDAYAAQHPDVSRRAVRDDRGDRHGSRHTDEIIDSVFEPFFTTKQPG